LFVQWINLDATSGGRKLLLSEGQTMKLQNPTVRDERGNLPPLVLTVTGDDVTVNLELDGGNPHRLLTFRWAAGHYEVLAHPAPAGGLVPTTETGHVLVVPG